MSKETLAIWTPLVGVFKTWILIDVWINWGQLGIRGTPMEHLGTLVWAFSKHVGDGIAVMAKTLALLEYLKLAKVEGFSNLLVEGDLG